MRPMFLAAAVATTLVLGCSSEDALGPEAMASLIATPVCSDPAPLKGVPDSGIEDQYIVVFVEGTAARVTAERYADSYNFTPRYVYEHALLGFAATLSKEVVAAIRCEPEVDYVEHDQKVSLGIG